MRRNCEPKLKLQPPRSREERPRDFMPKLKLKESDRRMKRRHRDRSRKSRQERRLKMQSMHLTTTKK